MTKGESGGASMMLKTGMEVVQYYTVFNYGPPRPQKDLNPQYRTIISEPGMKPAIKLFLPWHSKEKVGKETPPYALIMDNLETSLAPPVDKACGKTSVAIVDRFIKPIASELFGHPI